RMLAVEDDLLVENRRRRGRAGAAAVGRLLAADEVEGEIPRQTESTRAPPVQARLATGEKIAFLQLDDERRREDREEGVKRQQGESDPHEEERDEEKREAPLRIPFPPR